MKIMQVFDCHDMPKDVRAAFFSRASEMGNGAGNDCYIDWFVGECDGGDYSEVYSYTKEVRMVDTWLRQQSPELDAEVLIKHWW